MRRGGGVDRSKNWLGLYCRGGASATWTTNLPTVPLPNAFWEPMGRSFDDDLPAKTAWTENFLASRTNVGGCSGLNALIYLRGVPTDFLSWPESWQYPNNVAAYQAIEQKYFDESVHETLIA